MNKFCSIYIFPTFLCLLIYMGCVGPPEAEYGLVENFPVVINTHYSNDTRIVSSRLSSVNRPSKPQVVKMASQTPPPPPDTEQDKLDQVVTALEQEGVSLENYQEKKEGLGDVIGNIFTKLGVTEETVEKWSGIGGCGCQKRKKFLNKIIPFRKKA